MATLEAGTHSGTVTLKNSVEILTPENTYLKLAKKEHLNRYDQQVRKQCSITLATNPQRGPATPSKGRPHVTYCNR